MALIWVPQPMPKEARAARAAKSTPSHFRPRPRSRAYMAPPCILPSGVRTRYLTAMRDSAYLVAMPKIPAIQHQNTAPGPPRKMAVPTPMMLPVPMVEARAVVSAWNWLTSPGESGSRVTDRRMPVKVLRWIKPVRTVINRWVPSSRTIMGMPQIKPSSQFRKDTIAFIRILFSLSFSLTYFAPATSSAVRPWRSCRCPAAAPAAGGSGGRPPCRRICSPAAS